jgi:hypothetical protein
MSYSLSCQELAFSEIHIQYPAKPRPRSGPGYPSYCRKDTPAHLSRLWLLLWG